MGTGQTMEYIPLRNDLLFHMVFSRNQAALKALLSALLGIPEEKITRIEVLNPMQYSETNLTKTTILDLKVHLNDGTYVLVEMQVRKFEFWTNRSLVYASRAVADQVEGEFNYGKLEPVIQISIMDYSLFPDHKRFFAKYTLRDKENFEYTDKLRFYVLDLTQIGAATDEEKKQGLVEWAKAFRARSWAEVNGIENTGVKEAAKTMQVIMANPAERELIRMRQDSANDWYTQIRAAERRGAQNAQKAVERAEARAAQEAQARAQAEARAAQAEAQAAQAEAQAAQAKFEMAKILKHKGVDPVMIAAGSGLTLDEIATL